MIHSKTFLLAGARRSTSACASTPHWRCHPCSVWMMYVLIFLLFLEGDHLHIYVYTYIHVDPSKKPNLPVKSSKNSGGRCLFFLCFKQKEDDEFEGWWKTWWPKEFEGKILGPNLGKEILSQRYARLLGHEKGKQSLEGGSRMDPGEGSGKHSYTMCIYILYIYMYIYNIYVCIYIYTYIYHLIIFHLKKSETHMNETAAWLSSCCIPSRFLTDRYETLGKMSQDEVPQKVHFSEGNGTFAPKCWKGNLTAWGVLRLWMVLVSQRPQTMLALRGLRTCKTTCLTINGLGRKQCYGIFMCDGSWCLL